MGRKYMRLDVERERYSTLLATIELGNTIEDIRPFQKKPGSAGWIAIEENLFRALGSDAGRQEGLRLFNVLGYADRYMESLSSKRKWEQALSAEKLGRINCRGAVPNLMDSLKSPNRDLQLMAIHSLGVIGDETAIPPLVALLKQSVAAEEEISLTVLKSSILAFGQNAVMWLVPCLNDPDWRMRSTVLDVLGEIGDRRLSGEFMRMLKDTEQDVRAKAAKGIGKLKCREAVPMLMEALADQFWVVRLHSARSLGLMKEPVAIAPLTEMLGDKNWQVRSVVAEAMSRIGGRAFVEMLNVFIDSTDKYARDQALDELGRKGVYAKLMARLYAGNGPEPPLKLNESPKTDDKVDVDREILDEMLSVLSTLNDFRLYEVLDALSGGKGGEANEEAARAVSELKGRERTAPGPERPTGIIS
ncbi:MAG: HEAT repeat domain-containing protein [Deltaproteobacteria bacterium]|nr:HEAT repeat domain-containing protein [Deltaproteobacteria bacterium]